MIATQEHLEQQTKERADNNAASMDRRRANNTRRLAKRSADFGLGISRVQAVKDLIDLIEHNSELIKIALHVLRPYSKDGQRMMNLYLQLKVLRGIARRKEKTIVTIATLGALVTRRSGKPAHPQFKKTILYPQKNP